MQKFLGEVNYSLNYQLFQLIHEVKRVSTKFEELISCMIIILEACV